MAWTRAAWRWAGAAAIVLVSAALAVPVAVALRHEPPPRGTPVSVLLDDFRVRSDRAVVPAGPVRFRLANNGPSTHELIVVRTDRAADRLPLQHDGLTVEEEGSGVHHVGEAEGLDIGDRRTLVLGLTPGHYVLFCNMEGHYLGGMHVGFTVR